MERCRIVQLGLFSKPRRLAGVDGKGWIANAVKCGD